MCIVGIMAVSAEGFGISCAFWFGGMLALALLFQYLRRLSWTERYYQRKHFFPPIEKGLQPPPFIPKSSYWPKAVVTMTEKTFLSAAGMDASMYCMSLRVAVEVFVLVTFFTCAIVLPINITGDNVDQLSKPYDESTISPYIEWYLPGLNGTEIEDMEGTEDDTVKTINAPEIYNNSIGPAPPGLIWWELLPDVPPLPTPEEELGPAYANYSWKYDDNYKVVQYDLTDLDKTTMTNVAKRSSSLYAHAIMTWWLTILVMWRLGVANKYALNLRLLFFMSGAGDAHARSVLVRDVPLATSRAAGEGDEDGDGEAVDENGSMSWFEKKFGKTLTKRRAVPESDGGHGKDEKDDGKLAFVLPDRWEEAANKVLGKERGHTWLVKHEFEAMYGKEEVVDSQAVYNTGKLHKLVAAYENTKEAAFATCDKVLSSYTDEKKRMKMKKAQKTVIGKTMGAWGSEKYGMKPKKVDAFEFYVDRLQYLREEVLSEQKAAKNNALPSAFVSFRSTRAQAMASQTMLCEDTSSWVTGPAPGPDELVWDNLRIRKRERDIRATTYTVLFWVLMAFYMIPVAAVQVLLSSDSLVGFLETIPIANSILTGIIPGLALRIFIIILPMIISAMLLKIRGVISSSELDGRLVSGMYIFQFITLFLGSFIAGTFANQFQQILDDPGSIVQIFGTAAPQVGLFFMTYILTIACWEVPLGIVDAVGLIIYHAKLKLASTTRSKNQVNKASSSFGYGASIPDDGIIFLLGMSFSIATPLVAPCALIYFSVRYVVNRHNIAYKCTPAYEAGGSFWLNAFNQYVCSLVAMQLIMIFVLAIKESIAPPIIVVPLPFITIFWWLSARNALRQPFAKVSIMMASDVDQKVSEPGALKDAYLDPAFVFDEADHDVAIHQCKVLMEAQAEEEWPNETIATILATNASPGDTDAFLDVEEQ